MPKTLVLVLLAQILIPVLASADPLLTGPGVKVSLISEKKVISGREPFTLALHLQHDPGFHTYWKNPGIVGLPTSIEWSLPAGWSASEIKWPYPERTMMGIHPCWGYERDVSLLVEIRPSPNLTEKVAHLSAEVMWMCCAKGCFPGYQTFTLNLPVGEDSINQENHQLIEQAQAELPKKLEKDQVEILTSAEQEKITLRIQSEKDLSDHSVEFFSFDEQVCSSSEQTFTYSSKAHGHLSIERSPRSPDAPERLRGILSLPSGSYHIDLPYPDKSEPVSK